MEHVLHHAGRHCGRSGRNFRILVIVDTLNVVTAVVDVAMLLGRGTGGGGVPAGAMVVVHVVLVGTSVDYHPAGGARVSIWSYPLTRALWILSTCICLLR